MTRNEAIKEIIDIIAPKEMSKEEKKWWVNYSIAWSNKQENKEKEKRK